MERYLVFGRTDYAESLSHRGFLEAASPDEARQVAAETFGRDWVELSLVAASGVTWVIREGEAGRERERDD